MAANRGRRGAAFRLTIWRKENTPQILRKYQRIEMGGQCALVAAGMRAMETVRAGETGLFFDEQTSESLAAALQRFDREAPAFNAAACREQARRFAAARFRAELSAEVQRVLAEEADLSR